VALLISKELSLSTFTLLTSLILVFNLRQRMPASMNTFLAYFVTYYTVLNFSVNFFDVCWNNAYRGLSYRRDSDFTSSFSYKSHQIVLVTLLAFISGQFTH